MLASLKHLPADCMVDTRRLVSLLVVRYRVEIRY